MITEIILIIFAILYYLFSIFLFTTITIDTDKINNQFQSFGLFLEVLILSPIATPIILGIELGDWIKNN